MKRTRPPSRELPTWGADVNAAYWDPDPTRAYRVWCAALGCWESDIGIDQYHAIKAGESTPFAERKPPSAAFIRRARRKADL
ncbi:hypothetical protein HDA32_000120 [Spinactinospora alkalitolerans]|uniref:Uncharacterized protein n=1 Tax=Spinactinospora alkalitolerans TaxID=687207 RepID=A0A852TSQ1_9ACTN|nr:hypothetical protein [Spinactinospora alkalitolerans]NYE45000.1 hypothetical protein [Spinactinospora alkalitolerans]